MSLFYYKDSSGLRNYGDDLNPWFWKEQLGAAVYDIPDDVMLVGIGTILNNAIDEMKTEGGVLVCGAGVWHSDNVPAITDKWKIYCVRGPLSAESLGLNKEAGIVDPAILVGEMYPVNKEKKFEYSYMPHAAFMHEGWIDVCRQANVHLIDARKSIFEVMEEIASTKILLTEAMHGAITAEAYRVPWVAVRTNPVINEFKWQDWCASLELEYEPAEILQVWPSPSDGGAFRHFKNGVKQRLVTNQLRRLCKTSMSIISENSIFESKKEKLREQLGRLREDLQRMAFS